MPGRNRLGNKINGSRACEILRDVVSTLDVCKCVKTKREGIITMDRGVRQAPEILRSFLVSTLFIT